MRSGAADLAVVVPGVTPKGFSDTAVFGLPGLFRSNEEASLVFTRLIEANALEGCGSFFVVGAYVLGGETINSRVPIAAFADLKGRTIASTKRLLPTS